MKPTPEIEEKGMRAYERVKAFARVKTWRLPVSYGVVVLIPALTGVASWWVGYTALALSNFAAAVLFAVAVGSHWKGLLARDAEDFLFLASLKKMHGDQLPWVQVENHFAALERLKAEGDSAADEGNL